MRTTILILVVLGTVGCKKKEPTFEERRKRTLDEMSANGPASFELAEDDETLLMKVPAPLECQPMIAGMMAGAARGGDPGEETIALSLDVVAIKCTDTKGTVTYDLLEKAFVER